MAVWQDESILSGCVVGPITAQAKYSFDRSLDNSVLKDSFGRSTGFRHELLCSVSCCYVTVLLSVLSFFSNDADTSSTPHGLNDHVKVPSTVSVQLRREQLLAVHFTATFFQRHAHWVQHLQRRPQVGGAYETLQQHRDSLIMWLLDVRRVSQLTQRHGGGLQLLPLLTPIASLASMACNGRSSKHAARHDSSISNCTGNRGRSFDSAAYPHCYCLHCTQHAAETDE